jgi:hypothetical protein
MHRSGTSAVTGVLVRLGAAAPRTLLPPADDNPLGFWESAPLLAFHDRLLHAAGSEWDLWSRVVPENMAVDIRQPLEDEFGALLEQEFGESALFAVKDPRMCRLMPFWLHALRARDIRIGVVLALRHPFEVAQSLSRRDGVTAEHGLLLWLRHVLDSEVTTREASRTIADYEELLRDWRGAVARIGADLGIEWPVLEPDAAQAIDAFVQPAMRHQVSGVDDVAVAPPLSTWVTDAWRALQQLRAHADDRQALATLDRVRSELDTIPPVFEQILLNERGRQRVQTRDLQARYTIELDALREQAGATEWRLRERTATAEWERDQLRERLTFTEQEFQRLRGHADTLETGTRNSWNEVTGLREQVTALKEQNRGMGAQVEALKRQLAGAQAKAEWLSRQRSEAERRVEALERSFSWRLSAPLRAIAGVWVRRRALRSG